MYGIYLRYDHLCDILEISPTNDFYEILVPVTLPYMRSVYLQYPSSCIPTISIGYSSIREPQADPSHQRPLNPSQPEATSV